MIEIPESKTIVRQINETLKGKIITSAEANKSPHKFAWYSGNPENYNDLLEGKEIQGAISRAGMIEIQGDDCTILFCDGATPRFYSDYSKVPKKHQLCLKFDDESALAATIQMYGGLWAYREGENSNPYYIGACEKPSPFSEEFSYDYFKSLCTEDILSKSVKGFLATDQRIPGLGNGVLQDILCEAKLHPKRKMNTISEGDFKNLYYTIKKVLSDMVQGGGRDTEKDLFGDKGGYITRMSKNTYGTVCPRCGSEIQKESFLGGTIYFCDQCQRLE